MAKTTRTEIRIETHEIKVITFGNNSARVFCGRCGERVSAIDPQQAAGILSIPLSALTDLITRDTVHWVEQGSDLLCGRSVISKTNS